MRASLLLIIFCSQIRLIVAFAQAGAYERVWFWYCYQLDAVNTTPAIARTCRGSAPNKRCTFSEFLLHINLKDTIVTSPLLRVDTNDLARTAQAITDAKATGPFNAKHVFQGGYDQNDAQGTYQRMHTWMQSNIPKLATLSETGKANMKLATMTIAKIRMGENANYLATFFWKNNAVLSRTEKPIFEDSTDMVSYADRDSTIANHPTLTDEVGYDELVKTYETKDTGHSGNVRIMRSAAKTAFESCS